MSKTNKSQKMFQVREPNGRLSRSQEGKESVPGQVKRLMAAALSGMAEPYWGTQLGRLFLLKKLTPEQFAAGKWWAESAEEYSQAICSPRKPQANSFEKRGYSEPPDPDSGRGKEITADDLETMEEMREAHAILIHAGLNAEANVRAVCERDEAPIGEIGMKALIVGLERLAEHRGLTRKTKYVR